MFGLENIGSQVTGLVDTSIKGLGIELLKSAPGYGIVSQFFRKYISSRNKGELLGKREDATVVDAKEMESSKAKITKELGGTLNPIMKTWNIIKRLMGSSSIERANAELSNLQSYAGLYDSHMFVNDALEFSLSQLQRRISDKEGILSKLGFRTNAKVNSDPVVTQLKQTLKAWLQPFHSIIQGGVPKVGFSKNDWNFLTYIRNQIRSGAGSKYMKDMLSDFEQVLKEAHQAWQERYNADLKQKHQDEAAQRKRNSRPAQQLAQPA